MNEENNDKIDIKNPKGRISSISPIEWEYLDQKDYAQTNNNSLKSNFKNSYSKLDNINREYHHFPQHHSLVAEPTLHSLRISPTTLPTTKTATTTPIGAGDTITKNGKLDKSISERTNETITIPPSTHPPHSDKKKLRRKLSFQADERQGRKDFIIDVAATKSLLLHQEDIDGDSQITIEDPGPKTLKLGSLKSAGTVKHEIRGSYLLSNLLQELSLAEEQKYQRIILNEDLLHENPVQRLKRMITYWFWPALMRRLDINGIEAAIFDSKTEESVMNENKKNDTLNGIDNESIDSTSYRYIYVPSDDPIAYFYYQQVATMKPSLRLKVVQLPKVITAEYIHSIRNKSGILSLALRPKNSASLSRLPASQGRGSSNVTLSPPLFGENDTPSPSSTISNSIYSINKPSILRSFNTVSAGGLMDLISEYEGCPFIVPGGRFNEMYGWDSYFIVLGLLLCDSSSQPKQVPATTSVIPYIGHGHHFRHFEHTRNTLRYDPLDICKSIIDNFVYEIDHYGKICNANRSYYLGRSQPPFLTDMIVRVYDRLRSEKDKLIKEGRIDIDDNIYGGVINNNNNNNHFIADDEEDELKSWLADCIRAAIKEYKNVWMSEPRYDKTTGLSRYCPEGMRMPTETEPTHFDAILLPFAEKHGLSLENLKLSYQLGTLREPLLDEYFLHDRAIRESGHDTTYRFEGHCAHLATIDLNCLLYKYEIDIAHLLKTHFKSGLAEELFSEKMIEPWDWWMSQAAKRKEAVNKYCWDPEIEFYFDYDTVRCHRTEYESVTAYWALWSGICSKEQALSLIQKQLNKFEMPGGLVCGTEWSRGIISSQRPMKQWDYPYGWAPHQILAWEGLVHYGFSEIARRLAYRWLFMMTKSFVEYNGVVPEKYDVVKMSHKLNVEYGNVGVDFKFIPREGFGWMNSSYLIGLKLLDDQEVKALGALIPPEQFYKKKKKSLAAE